MGAIPFRLIRCLLRNKGVFADGRFDERKFNAISLPELHDVLQPECLYVADAENAQKLCREHPECCFIVPTDKPSEFYSRNFARIKYNGGRLQVLYEINQVSDSYFTWTDELRDMVVRHCDFQDFFDASVSYLKYWMALVDDSFRLVAYTKNVTIDDPTCNALIRNGRHTLEATRRLQPIRPESDEKSFFFSPGRLRYESAVRVFPLGEQGGGHLIAVNCANVTSEEYLISANLFADILEERFNVGISTLGTRRGRRPVDALLDVLTRRETANNSMPSCIHYAHELGFEKEAGYLFGFVRLREPTIENLLRTDSFVTQLADGCLSSINGDRVIVLISVGRDDGQSVLSEIDAFLRDIDGQLFLSELCGTFTNLPLAFEQASVLRNLHAALSLVQDRKVRGDWRNPQGKRVALFENYFLAWFLSSDKSDYAFVKYCLERRFACKIAHASAYDFFIVEVYLRSERSATAAANILGMNRSTLMYNVRRIEKEYGVSFDSYETRFEFQLILGYCRSFSPNLIAEQPEPEDGAE